MTISVTTSISNPDRGPSVNATITDARTAAADRKPSTPPEGMNSSSATKAIAAISKQIDQVSGSMT
jgi:hypothetical protein